MPKVAQRAAARPTVDLRAVALGDLLPALLEDVRARAARRGIDLDLEPRPLAKCDAKAPPPPPRLTTLQRRRVRELMVDEGCTRAEAVAETLADAEPLLAAFGGRR